MASTHFATVNNGTVIGSRSSASRHIDGLGKFGPYTHAVAYTAPDSTMHVVSWHGSLALAQAGAQAWSRIAANRAAHWPAVGAGFVAPVIVTTKRAAVGVSVDSLTVVTIAAEKGGR